jgi:glucose-1-phosphate thymidylyltransferase
MLGIVPAAGEYLRRGGQARGMPAGERYFDVGTVDGYRAAIEALKEPEPQLSSAAADS